MKLDVAAVRAGYPALADGYAYLDGAAGTQVPAAVIEAMSEAQAAGWATRRGAFPASKRADAITADCRAAVGGADRRRPWRRDPRAEHDHAHLPAGGDAGQGLGDQATRSSCPGWTTTPMCGPGCRRPSGRARSLRWAEVDPATGELPAGQYGELVTDRTRLVAVTAASNVIGTRPDVPAITAMARAAGALSYVDGVHATPHVPVDVRALGADFYATSAYKWSGPHIGGSHRRPGAAGRAAPGQAGARARRRARPVRAGHAAVRELGRSDCGGAAPGRPGRVTRGAGGASGTGLRHRVLISMAAVQQHEQELFEVLLAGLDSMRHVRTYGRAPSRTATAYFTVAGRTPQQVAEHMASRKINVWHGDNYAWELTGVLGIRDAGSAVRAGLVHYNDCSEVDRLLVAVAELGG